MDNCWRRGYSGEEIQVYQIPLARKPIQKNVLFKKKKPCKSNRIVIEVYLLDE